MKLQVNESSIGFYEALASVTRLKIIRLLAQGDLNIKELAEKIGISSSIMTKHIQKLERANIVMSRMSKKDGSQQKSVTLLNRAYELEMPIRRTNQRNFHEVAIPVGHYTDVSVKPPCGLATSAEVIGGLDEPSFFWKPERVQAGLVWLSEGYVEYCIPNLLLQAHRLDEVEITAELASEATGYCDDWPSDITLSLNGQDICTLTTPGDFGDMRGTLTPDWWVNNQYGLLYIIRLTDQGVYLNGNRCAVVRLAEFGLDTEKWILRFEVRKDARFVGGLSIFGKTFGNYRQDILVRTYYNEDGLN